MKSCLIIFILIGNMMTFAANAAAPPVHNTRYSSPRQWELNSVGDSLNLDFEEATLEGWEVGGEGCQRPAKSLLYIHRRRKPGPLGLCLCFTAGNNVPG